MKALKSLLTNRYSTCIIVVCGLKVLLNQDQFQRIQKWHSVDLKLDDQSYIENSVSHHSIIWKQIPFHKNVISCFIV